jgi:murein DD-endopeptidase MepM/ murein hydrolase activator NlpD
VKILSFLFGLILSYRAFPQSGDGSNQILAEGRQTASIFFSGTLAPLWEKFTPAVQGEIGSLEKFHKLRLQMLEPLGEEIEVENEDTQNFIGDYRFYYRDSKFSKSKRTITFTVLFGEDWKITGFDLAIRAQEAPSDYLDYKTKTDLALPFADSWLVVWGGRDVRQNYHAAHIPQRFAIDFVVAVDNQTFSGSGRNLEDYYAWGKDILAPGVGKIIHIENSLPDQPIGSSDTQNPAGNHVVIDHLNGEYSYIAHFKNGSIQVKKGDLVAKGQAIGKCGNSGNSSEPHIHYHMQTSGQFNLSPGLPTQFQNYLVNGKFVNRGEVSRGQTVTPK